MAEYLEHAGFWLPPQFLSDQDKYQFCKKDNNRSTARFNTAVSFPIEFPYSFDSFTPNNTGLSLDSPVESVISSNETENSDDEEDFFAALTQRLSQSTLRESQLLTVPDLIHNKSEAMAGSPQSTLTGFGNWSGWSTVSSDGSPNGPSQAPSPPATPFGADTKTWDLIYAAAGQVARLKNASGGLYSSPSQFTGAKTEDSLFSSDSSLTWGRQVKLARSPPQVENYPQIQRRSRDIYHQQALDFPQPAWPSLQPHQRSHPSQPLRTPAMAPVFHCGGSAPKKECAGTGVFLPRRYDNPSQSRKRTDCRPVSMVKPAMEARNTSLDDLNRSAPRSTNRRLAPSHDALIGRRNAIFAQQMFNYHRPTEAGARAISHELLLPHEWTY